MTSTTVSAPASCASPSLPLEEWQDTCATLHLWTCRTTPSAKRSRPTTPCSNSFKRPTRRRRTWATGIAHLSRAVEAHRRQSECKERHDGGGRAGIASGDGPPGVTASWHPRALAPGRAASPSRAGRRRSTCRCSRRSARAPDPPPARSPARRSRTTRSDRALPSQPASAAGPSDSGRRCRRQTRRGSCRAG